LQVFNSSQSIAALVSLGISCGFMCLCTTLISVACSQLEKLNTAILDITQEHITSLHGQEDEQDHKTVNSILQDKLNACIRHHQEIME